MTRTLSLKDLRYPITFIIIKRSVTINCISVINYYTFIVPKEIKRLEEYSNKEGYTLVPLELYFKNNKAKIKLGVAKGKHNYDKRQAIKERKLLREAKNTQEKKLILHKGKVN